MPSTQATAPAAAVWGKPMATFNMKIAGHVGRIHTQFDSTQSYCSKYLTQEEPHFTAVITEEDRHLEQLESWAEAKVEGFRPRKYTDPHLERAAIQRKFAEYLFDQDILMCHGSLVAVDGQAYLFTAKSGTGKSTHTRLWCQLFGERAVIINDDKPFLALTETGILASGSPWSGKHGLDANITVPLKGICILERGLEDSISPLAPEDAIEMLLWQSYCPLEEEKASRQEALVRKIAQRTKLWKMACTKEISAALVAYQAMVE